MRNDLRAVLVSAFAILLGFGCSPISKQLRQQAEPGVAFKDLADDAESYSGKIVILGGYVLDLRSEPGETVVTVLQAPLAGEGRPQSREDSQGVFLVSIKGDAPERLNRQDQEITVAGRVAGLSNEDPRYCGAGCVKLEALETYVWPAVQSPDYRLWPRYPYEKGARSWQGL